MPANRLAELRQKEDISQAVLAQDLGVTVSTIWRWEHGRVAIPDVHKVALARRFSVDVAYLMGWSTEQAAA